MRFEEYLSAFKEHLKERNLSDRTVETCGFNVEKILNFLEKHHPRIDAIEKVNREIVQDYQRFLAMQSRLRAATVCGLTACLAAPEGLSPKTILRRRTLWLVKRCCFAVLFPERPFSKRWGPGSRLVYRSCLDQLKPLFVVSAECPPQS